MKQGKNGKSMDDIKEVLEVRSTSNTDWVEHMCRLTEKTLLIIAQLYNQKDYPIKVFYSNAYENVPLEFSIFSYNRSNFRGNGSRMTSEKVIVVELPENVEYYNLNGNLVIKTSIDDLLIGSADVLDKETDLRTILRNNFAGLDAEVRKELMNFLVSSLAKHQGTEKGREINRTLFTLREVLRERLPACVVEPNQQYGLNIEQILAVDDKSFYIKGWIYNRETEITRLTAVSPEGVCAELIDKTFLYPRNDIIEYYNLPKEGRSKPKNGFISYFELPVPSHLPDGWVIEMQTMGGGIIEADAPQVINDYLQVRNTILTDTNISRQVENDLMQNQMYPALRRLQGLHSESIEIERIDQYGIPNDSPRVSIIVPLYKRLKFLEHQLAQFTHDEEIKRSDLIYVLDSPEQADDLREIAARLTKLYGVPFRIVTLTSNGGFSVANNLGASVARANLLLLLNSDILPSEPGWLEKMADFYNSTPKIGALGTKLLFEDDTLQHAGMYFDMLVDCPEWENRHYFKGFHHTLPAANIVRKVPGVTAACMMINTDLYKSVGGLRGLYVQGDYEDSDLCLRLIEKGHENWYLPEVELYHLEGQSYPSLARQQNTKYNRWLHTHLWGEKIVNVMNGYTSTS